VKDLAERVTTFGAVRNSCAVLIECLSSDDPGVQIVDDHDLAGVADRAGTGAIVLGWHTDDSIHPVGSTGEQAERDGFTEPVPCLSRSRNTWRVLIDGSRVAKAGSEEAAPSGVILPRDIAAWNADGHHWRVDA